MFFDFECTQDDCKHIPNLCVVQNESGDEFCTWVFQQENAITTFVAHNFQTYDGYFILQYLYKNGITPEIITRGAKVLSLTVSEMNIKFVDSLCFIPMKLPPSRKRLVSQSFRRVTSLISRTVLRTKTTWVLFQTRSSTTLTA